MTKPLYPDATEFLGQMRSHYAERYTDAIWFMRDIQQAERQKTREAAYPRLSEALRALRKGSDKVAPPVQLRLLRSVR